jgi:hypothetical protein
MKYGTIPLSIYTHKGETHNSLRKERRKEKKENFKTTKWTRQFHLFCSDEEKIIFYGPRGGSMAFRQNLEGW